MRYNFWFVIVALALLPESGLFAQIPQLQWQKGYGGIKEDLFHSIIQTSDGGYAVAGYSYSSDGQLDTSHGFRDAWIVKLDQSGTVEWSVSFGGDDDDEANQIIQTTEGDFIIVGYTGSANGDFSDSHGFADAWVARVDSTGKLLWRKCYGGSAADGARSVCQTSDGAFVFAGTTSSTDGDVSGSLGLGDGWVVKLGADGNILWQQCYGDTLQDILYSIIPTDDGGLIFAGESESFATNHGRFDAWVTKIDSAHTIEWTRCYGGQSLECAYSIAQTIDGSYVFTGKAGVDGGDVNGVHGFEDVWVVKLKGNGDIQWQKCLGGSAFDFSRSIAATTDGGCIISSSSNSSDGDKSEALGNVDAWCVQLDPAGEILWEKSIGRTSTDDPKCIIQTADGGYAFCGYTHFLDDIADVRAWVVKLSSAADVEPVLVGSSLIAYPNPVSTNCNVEYTLDVASPVEFSVMDVLGRPLIKVHEDTRESGTHSLQLDLQSIPPGTYSLLLTAEGKRESKMIQVYR